MPSIVNEPAGGLSRLINETNIETLFGVKFTSLSDIDDFSMSIKEGKYADILSTMSSADIDAVVNVIETIGKKFQDEVNKAMVCNLGNIDVAATFGVPLTTVGDLHKLINDIKAGKHEELLSGMTNNDCMETLDALENWRFPLLKTSYETNRVKQGLEKSHAEYKGAFCFFLYNFESKVGLEAVLESGPWMINKKRKGKSKSTNGGQFTGPSVKQTVRYEPKATTSAPKKGATNVSNPSKLSSMLKTANTSPNNDNFTTSNSFSALNDEEEDDEEVENVYNESDNLVPNTNTDRSSSFTAAVG
ncbi:hypothetical protein Tco_1507004 [Tanacetum coccineum]